MVAARQSSKTLKRYEEKRHFTVTPEPRGAVGPPHDTLSFVIQKHWASHLHYDFRLELDGILLSWAVPKGPCLDPRVKRIAIAVEDHPLDYAAFEGTIPEKQYGAGEVIVWDQGTWEPIGNARAGMKAGKLAFALHGQKLVGQWELVRIATGPRVQNQWILFKKKDAWARTLAAYDVLVALPDSVIRHPLGLAEERSLSSHPKPSTTAQKGARGQHQNRAPGVKAPVPAALKPQLATLARTVPSTGDWIYEIKFDGYRVLTRIDEGKVRLLTRAGHDWTDRMQPLARALAELGLRNAWLDGEVVALNAAGVPDFQLLQSAFERSAAHGLTYFVFDVPYLEGRDLRGASLQDRKGLLRPILEARAVDSVRFTEHFRSDARSVLATACAMKLEGVIAKRTDAPYRSGRTDTWLKLKCTERQEFVVVGFTGRKGSKSALGSLLLGTYQDGALRYAGKVGTGWNSAASAELHTRLATLETTRSALATRPVRTARSISGTAAAERWVKPTLVVEVAFSEWTADGRLRHPVFKGVREDKPARAVVRETAPVARSAPRRSANATQRVWATPVSHPQRVIDASSGISKAELVHYYESVAERMLPHLQGRPLSLVRAPAGVAGTQFFQKHDEKKSLPGMRRLPTALWPGHEALLEAPDIDAIVHAAALNVVEFHTWNAIAPRLTRPNRIVLDLDPGAGVSWQHMQDAALLVRSLLSELGLVAWLKTSGGKGLHVVVPLAARHEAARVKDLSQRMTRHLSDTFPERFVSQSGPARRVGRIFIDWLRNGPGQTTVAAFSARARPGLGVSMPVAWDQLSHLKSGSDWTIRNAHDYLSFQKSDPWADYWGCRQTLTKAMKILAR